MEIKKDIVLRFGILYLLVLVLALWILGNVFVLQFVEGAAYREKEKMQTDKDIIIEANRGDILAADGRKLACSVPSYRIYMDMLAGGLTDEVFNNNVDSLAICLAGFFGNASASTYRTQLKKARQKGNRYFRVNPRRISYTDLQVVKTFPLFRLGANKGGFIPKQYDRRKLPFGILASRTIGKLYGEKDKGGMVGLERAYNRELRGLNGLSNRTRVSGRWVTEEQLEPVDGKDIVSTIDINIQDVAENALMKQLKKQNADHGVAILMQVQTGEIKAIVNLQRTSTGAYIEDHFNYAIGEATEPGSTFKLASMIVALEDGVVKLSDSIETGRGVCRFYDRTMKDSHHGGFGKITVRDVFEKSSNVGISKIIFKNYKDNPRRFVDRLYEMKLNEPLGLEIKGEDRPLIKYPGDPSWSGVTLPWMSIGYELKQTPLQILTFYNAIANNGRMMKPMLVKAISHHGEIEQVFNPEEIHPSICSLETVEKVHELLKGVVEKGTAKNIKNDRYKIAGKTGTAQIAKGTTGYHGKNGVEYQASFVGYFPADKPVYSCVVVVTGPSNNVYYGNVVAGSVFKEISDRVYASSYLMPEMMETSEIEVANYMPYSKGGKKEELQRVFSELAVKLKNTDIQSEWISTQAREYDVSFRPKGFPRGIVPNVNGMGAKDAVCVLENAGFKVVINGVGKVIEQSLAPGQTYKNGARIFLKLN
ncbi:PASTA domain-containing protein [Marinilabiliaceae bacterium JC017]|nr:PASTA domain-containing protein [Marinilabiliaceae bacterium JC017]